MPIYEYECQQCGKVFETIQKFSDPRLTECPCDEKAAVTKLISAAAFHLKGTGWYVTDFRDKGKKQDKAAGSDDQGGSGKEEPSSDAKDKSSESASSGDEGASANGKSSREAGTDSSAKAASGSDGSKSSGGRSERAAAD